MTTKTRWIIRTIRILLSLVVIYGMYTETGIWTAAFGVLVLLAIEGEVMVSDEQANVNQSITACFASVDKAIESIQNRLRLRD